jgi:5'-phosphate synthase pdxT subunit
MAPTALAAPRVGVLALQGDFQAHARRLEALGAATVLIRTPALLARVHGLVIPGGESTALLRLLGADGLDALKAAVRALPTLGTCAGAVLLASDVSNPHQASLAALDIGVRRNAYGRQADSAVRRGSWFGSPFEMSFIRAPRIVRVGPSVDVVGIVDDEPVAVRSGHIVATTFHPELGEDDRVHRLLLDMIDRRAGLPPPAHAPL